jgi:aspartate racemase
VLRIGLLGGTSWESSAHYYSQLNVGVRDRLGGKHSADLVLRSLPFDEVCRLQEADDWDALGTWYAAEAATLAAGGAQVLGILANTMHLVYDDVVRGSGLPVVHVVDAVADAAQDGGFTTVGLLGTRYTMASAELYPPRLAARGITTLVPDEPDATEVNRVIYDELVRGQVLDRSRSAYLAIIDRLVARGAQAVVLGCTELALLLDPAGTDSPVPLLDSTSLHVDALLEAAIGPRSESFEALSLEEGAA